jgi:hypothetical protein
MNLALFVYLADILPSFSHLFFVASMVTLFVSIFWWVGMARGETDWNKKLYWLFSVGIVSAVISSLIPTEKTIYKMAAAYGIQTVYESEDAQRIGNKLLLTIESKLDEISTKEKK